MRTQHSYDKKASVLPIWGFSDKFRKARDITGLKQKEFAAKVDLTASTVAAYETGRSAPRFGDAQRLAKRLQLLTGVPADWFLVEDDPNVGPTGFDPMTSTVQTGRLATVTPIFGGAA
jgi:transcriptional regulator with XRE-family HTH domain